MEKKLIRKQLRLVLSRISETDRKIISKKISSNLSRLLKDLNSQKIIVNGMTIGAYSPLPDEFEWYLDLEDSELDSYELALPSMLDEERMEFQKFSLLEVKSKFQGLKLDSNHERVSPKVFLVPGLGFSYDFKRMGRGRGYYDRYLGNEKDAIKIGICSQLQLLETLPTENFDIDMDYLVTDEKIYRRGI